MSSFFEAVDGFRTVNVMQQEQGASAWKEFCCWAYEHGGSDKDTFSANWEAMMSAYIHDRFPGGFFMEYSIEKDDYAPVLSPKGDPVATQKKDGSYKTSKVSPTANAGKTLIGWAIESSVEYYNPVTEKCLSQSELQRMKREAEKKDPDPSDQAQKAADKLKKLYDQHLGDSAFRTAYEKAVSEIPLIN